MIRTHSTCGRTEARARAVEWLRRVGIPRPEEAYDAYPHELSGGLKQRAMIAMALSADPKVVVADEPTTALDVTVARQVLELLNDLKRERGLTLIFITHDLALLPGIADRVALMYAGEIVEMAPTEAFLAHPEHPYAQALLGALPRPDGAPLQPVEARCRIFGGRLRAALLRRAVHGPSQSALNMRLLLSLGAMGSVLCGASSPAKRRSPNAGRLLRPKL